jgi:hypothetical protein
VAGAREIYGSLDCVQDHEVVDETVCGGPVHAVHYHLCVGWIGW